MKHTQVLEMLAIGPIPVVVQDEVNGLAGRNDRLVGHQVAIALATSLHHVGLADAALTARAVDGIAELNQNTWLSDDFERRSPQLIDLVQSPPIPLGRRPATRETVTFTRPGDLLAIRVGGRYVVGHVHGDVAINRAPIIELYEQVFDDLPTPEVVSGGRAAGETLGDEPPSVSLFEVYGLRHVPDPAEQIHLIGVAQTSTPDRSLLGDPGTSGRYCELYDFLDRVADVASRGGIAEGNLPRPAWRSDRTR